MADFFNQPETKMEPENQDKTPEVIEVNGEKYTQEELSRLVGLGKIGDEAERTYKTKIDRVWPEYTKATQKIQSLEAKLAEREQQEIQTKAKEEPTKLSPEEAKQLARQQGKELGIMFQEDFDQLYLQRRSAEKLLEDIDAVVDEAGELGKPKTSRDAILNHMQQTGIKNPAKAYNDLYEAELETWKAEKLKEVKPSGLYTVSQSTAGSKQPAPVKVTKENLGQLVSEALSGV